MRNTKKGNGVLLERPEVKYAFIRDDREEFEIAIKCEVLDASRRGFYDGLTRDPIEKDLRFESLKEAMLDIFTKSRQTYRAPRMLHALLALGYKIGKEKVARLMRNLGLRPKASKKYKGATTDSKHKFPIASNKLNQEFETERPNTKWVGDVTFIETGEGGFISQLFSTYAQGR